MHQASLFSHESFSQQSIQIDNIKALFTNTGEQTYEVLLEINSNKFVVTMKEINNSIEELEIIATKGFIDISIKTLKTIKNLLEYLFIRL